MAQPAVNQTQFLFLCGDLDVRTFEVVDVSGEECLSQPYRFTVNLISKRVDIPADDVTGKRATLFIAREGQWYPYSGVVTSFGFVDQSTDYCRYRVVLVPRMWLLELNHQTRVFQKIDVIDIVRKVFEEARLGDCARFEVSGSYPEREFVVQYDETDLSFVSRLLEDAGVWYFFEEAPVAAAGLDRVGSETMVVTDRPECFGEIPEPCSVEYRSRSGLTERFYGGEARESLHRLSFDSLVAPRQTVRRNYNYRTPEVDLSATSRVPGGTGGATYRYGGNFRDVDGAQRAADIESGRIATCRDTVRGEGNCRALRAGSRLCIEGHARADLCGWFLVSEVRHNGSHGALGADNARAAYRNEFTLIPSDRLESYRPPRKTPVPRVPGLLTATIEGQGSDYASLDEMGRYKVRMPFDLSDTPNSGASKYVRLAQPYAGANYGMHFPSHEGAEMVLACVDGDPDRPLGIGTVPNANTVSPVTSANRESGVLRTAGSNEIVFDDTDGKQRIRIVTAAGNAAEFDDGNRRLVVQTTDANRILLDDKGEKAVLNAGKHVLSLSYKKGEEAIVISTAGGHVISIDDKEKSVTVQSNAGHSLQMDDKGKKMILSDCDGKNTVTLDAAGKLILDSKGEISINATKDIAIKGANVRLSASTGKVEVKAAQDLNLSGLKVNGKASTDLKLEGLNSTLSSSMNTKISGKLGVDIKSDLQAKVAGMTVDVSGQAMAKVKGGVVMIN